MGNKISTASSPQAKVSFISTCLNARYRTVNRKNDQIWVLPFADFNLIIQYDPNTGKLIQYVVVDTKIDPNNIAKRDKIIRHLDGLNFRLIVGNYEYDCNDGEIRFKHSGITAELTDIQFSFLFVTMLELTLSTWEKHRDEMLKLIKSTEPSSPPHSIRLDLDEERRKAAELDLIRRLATVSVSPNAAPAPTPIFLKTSEVHLGGSALPPVVVPASGMDHFLINGGDVRMGELLGTGAFGKVYRGTWNGTPVAVKQLQDQPGTDVAAGFKAEFESMVALRHPNIVMLLGVIMEPLSIVMEFVEGQSLEYLIHKSGGYDQVPISRRLEILRQVAAGLTYVHDRKIIHGDMKPANVMLDTAGKVRLVDLGLAKFRKTMEVTRTMTVVQAMGYTFAYASPELMMEGELSEFSDVYAFAVMMWEVIFKAVPYSEYTVSGMGFMVKIHGGLRPTIPANHTHPAIVALIQAGWQGNRADRPKIKVLGNQLDDVIETYRRNGS